MGRWPGVGFEAGSKRRRGVVQSGLRGPDGDGKSIGHLDQREVEVVMEDENRPLLERESPEGALELVAVVDGQDSLGLDRSVDRQKANVARPASATPRPGAALDGRATFAFCRSTDRSRPRES